MPESKDFWCMSVPLRENTAADPEQAQEQNEPDPEPLESEYSTVSVATGRVKRCMDCVSINPDKICSVLGFDRPSLTSPQHCPYYVVRGDVNIKSIPEDDAEYGPMAEFDTSLSESEPKRYLDDQGRVLFVSGGLSRDKFGTFWRSPSGGLHRVKSPAMPMVPSKEEAQQNLDDWAAKKGLQLAPEEGMD